MEGITLSTIQILGVIFGIVVVVSGAIIISEIIIRNRLRIPRFVNDDTCFLVSDKEWQAILGVIPIVILEPSTFSVPTKISG